MDIVQRVKSICLTPQTEWSVIAGETTPPAELVTSYVLPLAAIGAVAGFLGGSIVGVSVPFLGRYRVPLLNGLSFAIFSLAMAVVGVFVIAFLINALAPTFGAEKNSAQALKVAVYSYTPAWVAGVLRILPALGLLAILAALYGLYLLYLGLPSLMKCPKEKAVPYTAVVVVCAIALSLVIGVVGGTLGGAAAVGAGSFGASSSAMSQAAAQASPGGAPGRLQQLSNALDTANKKMDEAQAKGDTAGQAAAAMQGLGALLGGGSRVEPVDIDQLKPLLPQTFAGLTQTSTKAEKNGMFGISVSQAEADYGSGEKTVHLEISDTGGISGLTAFAGWAGAENEQEDANGSEKTTKVNGQLVHEKVTKDGSDNEYGIVLGDRFVVNATGNGVDTGALRSAVSGLNLGKLESMKGAGAPQQ
jgi:Yip1 domain